MATRLIFISDTGSKEDQKHATLRNVIENGLGLDYDAVEVLFLDDFTDTDDLITNVFSYEAKSVVTLGDKAFTAVTGLSDNVTYVRGKRFQLRGKLAEEPVIFPTFSSGYIFRVPTKLDDFANDIYKAYQYSQGIEPNSAMTPYKTVLNFEDLKTVVEYIKQTKLCGFDFETKTLKEGLGTHEKGFYATLLSLSFQSGSSYIIPLEHYESPFSKKEVEAIMKYLGHHIFSNNQIRKVAHNLNFDAHVLANYGVYLKGRIDDTMLMTHLVDETESKGLKETTSRYYPAYSGYDDEVKALVKKYGGWEKVPLKQLSDYAATDSDVALKLLTTLETELQKDERSYVIYRNLTMYAFRALFDAEDRGMLIDYDTLSEGIKYTDTLIQKKELELRDHRIVKRYELKKSDVMLQEEIDLIQAKIDVLKEKRSEPTQVEKERKHRVDVLEEQYNRDKDIKTLSKLEKAKESYNKAVNSRNTPTATEQKYLDRLSQLKTGSVAVYDGISFSSPKQLEHLLYLSDYGFQFTGVNGTGKDILESLNDKSGFVENLLIYRSLAKTQSTYLKGIRDRLDDKNRIHTSFLLSGTKSGRLSSQNPNLQNLPRGAKLSDEGLVSVVNYVKKVFKAPEGYHIVQVDYSQAELRIIAAFAGERNMIDVYKVDGDLHSKTAASLIGVSDEDFDKHNPKHKEARSDAKAVNFGFIYGMGAEGFVDYAWSTYRRRYTLPEAEMYRGNFFKSYPKLLDYHETYIQKGEKFGWVRTLFGRRRRLPDINSYDNFRKGNDERVAINSPIQGTAGEFTVFAIGLLRDRLDPRVLLGNTVHDSIIFYVPDEILHESISSIVYTCENLPMLQYFGKELPYGMKMKVDVELSNENWKSISEYTAPEN